MVMGGIGRDGQFGDAGDQVVVGGWRCRIRGVVELVEEGVGDGGEMGGGLPEAWDISLIIIVCCQAFLDIYPIKKILIELEGGGGVYLPS